MNKRIFKLPKVCLVAILLLLEIPSHSQTLAMAQKDRTAELGGKSVSRPLGEVLAELRRQYAVDLLFEAKTVEGFMVNPGLVDRQMSLEQNLDRLLRTVGLKYKRINRTSYTISVNANARASAREESRLKGGIQPPDGMPPLNELPPLVSLTKYDAQEKQSPALIDIKGKVSGEEGIALPGVSVVVKGTTQGTTTNQDGDFSIAVPNTSSVLVFSFVGYESQERTVGSVTQLDVSLQVDNKSLNEVVVVGYGTQKSQNLTGSVATVDGKQLALQPVGQTSAALQGAMPGVTIRQSSGNPGRDGGQIRIRGIGTLGNSNPLVLVDGVPTDLNNVDPNDIDNISVLKDASAAAVYGSRAANGVILITTKRAKAGEISFNYNSYAGFSQATNLPKLVNGLDHMLLMNEASTNVGGSPIFTDKFINDFKANSPSDLYPDTDWQREVLTGSGFRQNQYLSINAGTEKTKIFGSVGYFDQKGIIENSNFKRVSLRLNTDIKLTRKLNVGFDILARNSKTVEPSEGAETVIHWMNRVPANQGAVNTDGTYGLGWNGNNPLAKARSAGDRKEGLDEAVISIKLVYNPLDWLNVDFLYAPTYSLNNNKRFARTVDSYFDGKLTYTTPTISSLRESYTRNINQTLRGLVTATKNVARNEIKVLVGYEQIDFANRFISGFRQNFPIQDFPVLDLGSVENQNAGGAGTNNALQSVFGRVNYGFDNKYLLEANLRYDGSSRFSTGNKFGLFPSVSAGWVFSNETFMKGVKFVDFAKLRASYGRLGNQNIGGDFPYLSTISFGQNYSFGNRPIGGAGLLDLANPLISWETSEMSNVALDLGLFSGKLNLTYEYYIRNTDDILLRLPIPLTVGLNPPFQNAGKVRNTGWDFSLSYRDRVSDFKYNAQFNLSDVKNEITDLRGTGPFISGNQIRQVGEPIDALFGYEAQGYFQSKEEVTNHATQFGAVAPGDIKYRDINGDGLINADDRVVIGNNIPRFTYGLNLTLEYKGFDLNALFQGVGKVQSYLDGHGVFPFFVGGTVQQMHKDRWTPENPNAAFPRLAFQQTNNETVSSFWVRDASYLRFKNLQIGYSLPKSLVDRLSLQRARVSFGGQNLFSLDKFYDGFDVEAPVGNGSFYPIMKTYTLGLNINF